MEETAIGVRITGRVQGVSFRAWAQGEARARGLRGWMRNDPDGSVAAVIAGPRAEVEAMQAALWQGPPAARVTAVEATPCPLPAERDFVVTG